MLFNSIDFIIFLPIVVLGYYILPKKLKNLWLLVASYYFYMCWNALYAVLIISSTIITYLSGIGIEKIKRTNMSDAKKRSAKKVVVALSLLINLGILFAAAVCIFQFINQIYGIVYPQVNQCLCKIME